MKIKIVTIKDICRYLVRIGIVFAVIVIFANFFYSNRNVTSCISLDSTKLLGIVKDEILLLKNENDFNLGLFSKKNYSKQTFNSEISMFKAIANNNSDNTVIVAGDLNNNLDGNQNNNQSISQNVNTQDENNINNQNNSEGTNSNTQLTGFDSSSGLQEARNRFTS